jgi:hypothetical protein
MIEINAERLMMLGGITAFVLTINWVRNRELREKYAVGWICVASMLLILGLFPALIESFAKSAHLSYPAAVLFVALAVIYLFSFSVSVSLSRQYRRSTRLMQEVAILELRIRQLEQMLASKAQEAAASAPTEKENGDKRILPQQEFATPTHQTEHRNNVH